MSSRITAVAFLLLLATGCGNPTSPGQPVPTRPVTWVEGTLTQPVPAWGSPVRLDLPVPLSAILLGSGRGIGAYGAHQGGHPEGLDHVWIEITPGTPVRSWASGIVTRIDDMGDRGLGNGQHEFFIRIDYGDGLMGNHLDVDSALVRVGQRVQAGQPVAVAPSAEFMLTDNNRTDGERTGGTTGSQVSPFDYLRDDVKAALAARYQAEIVTPYFSVGRPCGSSRPWEPLLTNPMIFHEHHRGTLLGEWILLNRGWRVVDPVYYDIVTVLDTVTGSGNYRRLEMGDRDWSLPGSKRSATATWETGDGPGMIVARLEGGATWYGRYAIDESGGRARLTLEWQLGSYPAAITPAAAVYVERAPLYLQEDAHQLGIID